MGIEHQQHAVIFPKVSPEDGGHCIIIPCIPFRLLFNSWGIIYLPKNNHLFSSQIHSHPILIQSHQPQLYFNSFDQNPPTFLKSLIWVITMGDILIRKGRKWLFLSSIRDEVSVRKLECRIGGFPLFSRAEVSYLSTLKWILKLNRVIQQVVRKRVRG